MTGLLFTPASCCKAPQAPLIYDLPALSLPVLPSELPDGAAEFTDNLPGIAGTKSQACVVGSRGFKAEVAGKLQELLLWLVKQHELDMACEPSSLGSSPLRRFSGTNVGLANLDDPERRHSMNSFISESTVTNTRSLEPLRSEDVEPSSPVAVDNFSQEKTLEEKKSAAKKYSSSSKLQLCNEDEVVSYSSLTLKIPGSPSESTKVKVTGSQDLRISPLNSDMSASSETQMVKYGSLQTRSGNQVSPWLKIRIISARGLRKADLLSHSDPYCVCEIRGKPDTKVQTRVVQNDENPVWDEEFEFYDFSQGDVISFKVFDKDLFSDESLGTVELDSAVFFPSGCQTDLRLDEGDWADAGRRASICVNISVHGVKNPPSESIGMTAASSRVPRTVYKVSEVWKARRSLGSLEKERTDRTALPPRSFEHGFNFSEKTTRLTRLNRSFSNSGKMHPWVLHPNSYKRFIWEIMAIVIICYDVIMVPTEAFYQLPNSPFVLCLMLGPTLFWTADIFLTFLTGTYRNGVLQLKPKIIASLYFRRWFAMDVFLVVLGWTHMIRIMTETRHPDDVSIDFLHTLCLAKLIRLAKLWRYAENGYIANIIGVEIQGEFHSLCQHGLAFAISLHVLACAWYGIGRSREGSWVYEADLHTQDHFRSYVISLCWMLSLTTSHSVYVLEPDSVNLGDRWFLAVVSFLSFIFSVWFAGKMTCAIMHVMDNKLLKVQNTCFRYLQVRRIPAELSARTRKSVMSYHKKRYLERQSQQEAEMIKMLPHSLQAEVCEAARGPTLCHLQVMCDTHMAHPRVFRQLCQKAIVEETCLQEARIFGNGELCSATYFLDSGCLEYSLGLPGSGMISSPVVTFEGEFRNPTDTCGFNDSKALPQVLSRGQVVSESALWTTWHTCGDLDAVKDSILFKLRFEEFVEIITKFDEVLYDVSKYARAYVQHLNAIPLRSDILRIDLSLDSVDEEPVDIHEHLIFLSHYKMEAGTEATLMQEAFERAIGDDPGSPAAAFEAPVFVDSENLNDLSKLKEHITKSHNLLLLLTPGVLTRPWCLVEVVTAVRSHVQIVPVEVQRPGTKFVYPNEAFYSALRKGHGHGPLSKEAIKLLKNEGISLAAVEDSIRQVFQKISLPFSPHKTSNVRQAELSDILKRCKVKEKESDFRPVVKEKKDTSAVKKSVPLSTMLLSPSWSASPFYST